MDEGSRDVELANYPVGEGCGGNTDSRGVSGARSRQLNIQGHHTRRPVARGTKLRDWLAFLFIVVVVALGVLVPVAVTARKDR